VGRIVLKKKSRTLVFILSLLTVGLIPAYGGAPSADPDWVDWFKSSALSPSGELVATGDLVGNVKLWNLVDGKLLVLENAKNPTSIWETVTGKQLIVTGGFENTRSAIPRSRSPPTGRCS